MDAQPVSLATSPLETLPLLPLREASNAGPPPQPALPPAPTDDESVALADAVASSDLPRLAAFLEPHHTAQTAAHTTELLHQTTLALADGDRSRALANLNEIAATDPHILPILAPEKLLETIRPEVDLLLNRATNVAKMDAEGWLTQADHAVESGHHVPTNWQTKPEVLLNVAHRLYDAGGYANYVRSSDLAQSIVNYGPAPYSPFLEQYAAALTPKTVSLPGNMEDNDDRGKRRPNLLRATETTGAVLKSAKPRLLRLWTRAPLLVLLLGWLAIGLVAGPIAILLRGIWPDGWAVPFIDFGFQVWALGFLGLVCFGFYARIRQARA